MLALKIIATVFLSFSFITGILKNINLVNSNDLEDTAFIPISIWSILWRAFVIVSLWVI